MGLKKDDQGRYGSPDVRGGRAGANNIHKICYAAALDDPDFKPPVSSRRIPVLDTDEHDTEPRSRPRF